MQDNTEQETLDLDNILPYSTWKGGLDSSKNSKGNYVSLNRNFRGHFNTDEISDNMFHLQKAPSGQSSTKAIVNGGNHLYNFRQDGFEILEEVENE